jgi:hypothetical protein
MFTRDKEPTRLEKAIDRAHKELVGKQITSDEYATILNRLSTLHEMQVAEKPARVSNDTLVIVGANLLGILLIIKHENVNVITSKAMNMVPKLGTRV